MMVVKQKKCTRETLLTIFRNWSAAMSSGFPPTLRLFYVGHPWTPFPVFLPEHVALRHAILSAQVILRTGNGNSASVCPCMCSSSFACAWKKCGRSELETGYTGNNTKHKKCHMIWNTALIYLASERICCMWFGGENVFLLCSRSTQTQHMETFRRSHGSVKELYTFNFSLFSLGFGSKLIELHTSVCHM